MINEFIPKPLKKIIRVILNHKDQRVIKALDRQSLVSKVRNANLTYLSDRKLVAILKSLKEVNDNKIPGCFVEAGVALGGTLCIISGNSEWRTVYAYDTFEMIPPPTEKDPIEVHERYNEIKAGKSIGIGGDIYYGYRSDLLEFVSHNIETLCGKDNFNRTKFFKGLLQNTMDIKNEVAFAHIDVDWYDPVMHSVTHIWPLLSSGGIIVFDDYFEWGGCKKAVDEFFDGRYDYEFDPTGGNLKVTKVHN